MTLRDFLIPGVAAVMLTACNNEQQSAEGGEAAPAAKLIELEGSSWQLQEMIVLGGHSFIPETPADYSVAFRSDGRLTGKSDCNTFTAEWTDESGDVQIENIRFTRSMCIPGSLHNYFSLYLREVNKVTVSEQGLAFTTPTPDVRLSFQQAD